MISLGPLLISRRLLLLLVFLAALAGALPLSRRLLLTPEPLRPAASAPEDEWARYYEKVAVVHPANGNARLQIGLIEEGHRFYLAAIDSLLDARRLGVPDKETSAPLGRCYTQLARFEEARTELERAAKSNPDSAPIAVDYGNLFRQMGQDALASQILKDYLKHHPQLERLSTSRDADSLFALMLAAASYGDRHLSVRLALELEKARPADPAPHAVAGRDLLSLGRTREAESELANAVRMQPDLSGLHYLHGVALALLNRHDEAMKEWERAATLDPTASGAFFQLGSEYARRKDWRRAAAAYMFAAQTADSGARAYSAAAAMWRRAGRNEQVLYCEGEAAKADADNEKALKFYQKLAASHNPEWSRRGLQGASEMLRQLKRSKEYLHAAEELGAAGTAEGDMALADAYGELGRPDLRAKYLRSALSKDHRIAGHVHEELGKIAGANGQLDLVEREYKAAVAASPANAAYHHALADTYLKRRTSGDRAKLAVQEAETAAKLDPENAQAFESLGLAFSSSGKTALAIQALQHSIDLQPGYGPSYLQLGQIYAQIGDSDRSKTMLKLYRRYEAFDLQKQTLTTRALSNKKDPAAQLALAEFYAQAGAFSRALPLYRRAVELRPRDAAIRSKLAHTYRVLGEAQEASEQERMIRSGTSAP